MSLVNVCLTDIEQCSSIFDTNASGCMYNMKILHTWLFDMEQIYRRYLGHDGQHVCEYLPVFMRPNLRVLMCVCVLICVSRSKSEMPPNLRVLMCVCVLICVSRSACLVLRVSRYHLIVH